MSTDHSSKETSPTAEERIETFRRQLRVSLQAAGVDCYNQIASNIEGLIVAHILRLMAEGAKITLEFPLNG